MGLQAVNEAVDELLMPDLIKELELRLQEEAEVRHALLPVD